MIRSFSDYVVFKESEEKKPVRSEIKLEKEGDYKPFTIDAENNTNLRPIVKAFIDSPNVPLPGPRGIGSKLVTLDKTGETIPKLKKKSLYLVGGAVRDHLLGKKPKDFDLSTDATPDEIRLILANAGFKETAPQTGKHAPKKGYEALSDPGQKNKIFYAKGWDQGGREFVMGVKVNGEEFEIATFRKDSKSSDGRTPDKMEFADLEGDSERRDFTINSMYIPLTSPDGANSKLIDPHGGAHHLHQGEVKFVGNPKERLEEDQLRALRYIRFVTRFGPKSKVPQEYKDAIVAIKDLPAVSKERIRDEFLKGLENKDVDPIKYIQLYKDLELLGTVFPGMKFKLDVPEDFTDKKHKILAVAWILRENDPESITRMLAQGKWTNNEIRDITNLIKMNKWGGHYGKNDDEFHRGFYDMKSTISNSGLVDNLVKQWGEMNKMNPEMIEKFNKHKMSTKGYTRDTFGNQIVNPEITNLLGKTPQGKEFGDAIRHIETEKFKGSFPLNKGQSAV